MEYKMRYQLRPVLAGDGPHGAGIGRNSPPHDRIAGDRLHFRRPEPHVRTRCHEDGGHGLYATHAPGADRSGGDLSLCLL